MDAQAQPWWEYIQRTPEAIIGLLDLPDVMGHGCGEPVQQTPAPIYDAPAFGSGTGSTLILVHDKELGCVFALQRPGAAPAPAPTLESGYEIPSAPVYERRGAWFRVALKNGSGWIRHTDANDFAGYPELLSDNLAYIREGWDGKLRESPGDRGDVIALPAAWNPHLDKRIDIHYLGARMVRKELWIQVRLATETCDTKLDGVKPVTGWIRAYRLNRSPAVWFASRGC